MRKTRYATIQPDRDGIPTVHTANAVIELGFYDRFGGAFECTCLDCCASYDFSACAVERLFRHAP